MKKQVEQQECASPSFISEQAMPQTPGIKSLNSYAKSPFFDKNKSFKGIRNKNMSMTVKKQNQELMRNSMNLSTYDMNNEKYQNLMDEMKMLREENTQIKEQQEKQLKITEEQNDIIKSIK